MQNSYQCVNKILKYLFRLICFQILHMKKLQTSNLKTQNFHYVSQKCLQKPQEDTVTHKCCQLSWIHADKPLKNLTEDVRGKAEKYLNI